jgi:Ca2+:H+ antiporter
VTRRLLWASLVLAPVVLILRYVAHTGNTVLFVASALALVPLAWLIGEATEHASEHTGPGIGGFLNASFGNAPELIIALLAIAGSLPDVVRGSLAGSIVSNILLVLGAALALQTGEERTLDRPSLQIQLGLVFAAVGLLLIPSIPGWHGNPERHALAVISAPVAAVLLVLYFGATALTLRRHHRMHAESGIAGRESAWSLPRSLLILAIATAATAGVSEVLVHSLQSFSESVGLSRFFISAVIVAIVGNAAEHGGAVVIARRGKIRLATEIAISSSAQVGLLVIPAVALLSWIVSPALPLSFRPVELAAMGGSALFVGVVIWDGKSRRWEGFMLLAVYAAVAVGFGLAGDR